MTLSQLNTKWIGVVWFTGVFVLMTLAIGSNNAMSQSDHDHAPVYDQYTLQASAEGEVENDLMMVRLQVEHQDRDASKLADKVNSDMQWALKQLEGLPSINVKTENFTTYPKYEQNRIAGWHSSQTLSLSGQDFDAIKAAVQILQSRLQVQGMAFQPTDETRKSAEDELISKALDNLKHRASLVQKNMGAAGYRIVQVNINTGGRQPGRVRMNNEMMSMSRSASVEAAPAVESGESKISVNVSGQIQLQ